MGAGLKRWYALGSFIGDHLAFIAPICVAVGVLFPDVFGPVNTYAVPFLFACMTFQGSLGNTFGQVTSVFRKPWLMLCILALSHVVLPLLAFGLGQLLFGSDPELVTGIVLEYSVPVGVITFMWVGMFNGNSPLALATILVSTVIAPFSIPLTLQLLLGTVIHVDAWGMMLSMIEMVGIPAVLGMLVNQFTHGWGNDVLSPRIAPLIKLFVIVIITSNSTGMSSYVLHPTPQLLQVAAFVLIFSSMGYFAGLLAARVLRRTYPDLVTMSFATGLRNISAGAVIAGQYFPGSVAIFPIMVSTLLQQILAATFGNVLKRLRKAGGALPVPAVDGKASGSHRGAAV